MLRFSATSDSLSFMQRVDQRHMKTHQH